MPKNTKDSIVPERIRWQDICPACLKYDYPNHSPECEHWLRNPPYPSPLPSGERDGGMQKEDFYIFINHQGVKKCLSGYGVYLI
jgi:hypothetical protein